MGGVPRLRRRLRLVGRGHRSSRRLAPRLRVERTAHGLPGRRGHRRLPDVQPRGPVAQVAAAGGNRIQRAGYTTTFHDPSAIEPELRAQIEEMSEESRHGETERGFSMTLSRLFQPEDTGLHALGHARSRPAASTRSASGSPRPTIGGWSLDVMRRRTDTEGLPNGLIDANIVATIAHLAGAGAARARAELRDDARGPRGRPAEASRIESLTRPILQRLSQGTQMGTLSTFNEKFDPGWVPRYVVLDSVELVATQALVLAGAEGVTEIPVIGRFLGTIGAAVVTSRCCARSGRALAYGAAPSCRRSRRDARTGSPPSLHAPGHRRVRRRRARVRALARWRWTTCRCSSCSRSWRRCSWSSSSGPGSSCTRACGAWTSAAVVVVIAALVLIGLGSGEQPAVAPPESFERAMLVATGVLVVVALASYRSGPGWLLAAIAGLGFSGAAIAARASHHHDGIWETVWQPDDGLHRGRRDRRCALVPARAGAAGRRTQRRDPVRDRGRRARRRRRAGARRHGRATACCPASSSGSSWRSPGASCSR